MTALLLATVAGRAASAASFTPVWLDGPDHRAVVLVNGPIDPGDSAWLSRTLTNITHAAPGARTLAVALNTPGGNLLEGEALATVIHWNRLDTVLYPGATCASACAIMFLAGERKVLGLGARIGVHRVSTLSGIEDASTLDSSRRMARALTAMGASKRVADRLMATPPGGIAWLSASDLAGVHGMVFGTTPRVLPTGEFAHGWAFGQQVGRPDACPGVLSQYADGCRAGAAAVRVRR